MAHKINQIRFELSKHRFEAELKYLEEDNQEWNKERIEQLKQVLKTFITETDDKQVVKDKQQLDDEIMKNIYKKPWKKLIDIHKQIKLEEYFKETLKIENINKIMNQSNHKLKNNNLTVNYNIESGKIISIDELIKNSAGEYGLRKSKVKKDEVK
jgi:hypothetical protein